MSLALSLSSVLSASELAVKMSEEAVAAVERAAVVARKANIQANTALTAARLALEREERRNSEDPSVTLVTPIIQELVSNAMETPLPRNEEVERDDENDGCVDCEIDNSYHK